MKKNIHPNSTEAYHSTDKDTRRDAVLKVYETHHPYALTDREVMYEMGFTDMNEVRPRITELKEAGKIKETGIKRKDVYTGKSVSEKVFCSANEIKESTSARPQLCKHCGMTTYYVLSGRGFCTAGGICNGPKYNSQEILNI